MTAKKWTQTSDFNVNLACNLLSVKISLTATRFEWLLVFESKVGHCKVYCSLQKQTKATGFKGHVL